MDFKKSGPLANRGSSSAMTTTSDLRGRSNTVGVVMTQTSVTSSGDDDDNDRSRRRGRGGGGFRRFVDEGANDNDEDGKDDGGWFRRGVGRFNRVSGLVD